MSFFTVGANETIHYMGVCIKRLSAEWGSTEVSFRSFFASWPYSGGKGNSDFNWEQVSPTTKWLFFSNAVDLQGILQLLPRFRKLATTVKTLTRGSVFHPISCADVWGNWNFLTGVSLDFLITSKKWSVKTRIVILMSW